MNIYQVRIGDSHPDQLHAHKPGIFTYSAWTSLAEAQATDIYKGSLLLFLIFTLGGTYLLRWAPFAL